MSGPAVLVVDRSGLSLLAFLRATAEYANVPVIIFTGAFTGAPLSPEDPATARKHNAEVFQKPQPYSVLIGRVNQLLDRDPAA
jgi:hypothetical protein